MGANNSNSAKPNYLDQKEAALLKDLEDHFLVKKSDCDENCEESNESVLKSLESVQKIDYAEVKRRIELLKQKKDSGENSKSRKIINKPNEFLTKKLNIIKSK